MEVILANPRGFCAGVNMAIECLEECIRMFGSEIYVYHEIVHNKHVVDRFTEEGVTFVNELEEVPHGSILLFSAHGVSPEIRQLARDRDLRTVDATCPLVTKVHLEAIRYAKEGYNIILIGHEGHDEVLGTMGEAPDSITLVETPEDVGRLAFGPNDKLAYLTQTTLSVDEAGAVINALTARFSQIESPPKEDICYATTNRQDAVKEYVAGADLLIVLGSQNSSNSKRLMEIGQTQGIDSFLVDSVQDIDRSRIENAKKVVVTAGASAPEVLVQECISFLKTEFAATVNEETLREEHVSFPLPKELRLMQISDGPAS
jgi:4-hydroxy-3-methylbut-2-enyl diphosphate reductase